VNALNVLADTSSTSLELVSEDPRVSVSTLQEITAIAVSAIAVNDLVFMCRVFFI
jgi:hypothetical protein